MGEPDDAVTLLTGATGLVGFNVLEALMKRGRKVRALVRSLAKARRLLPDGVELAEGDITVAGSVERAASGCRAIYHAAGHPEQWLEDEGRFEEVNVGGTRNVVAAARAAKVERLVYTSTIDVFAAGQGEEYDESVLDPDPKGTAYERSKQAADRLVAEAIEDGLPAVFLHPAAVYGPGPAGSPGINDFVVRLRDGKVPMLLPGGMPVVYAPDVGDAHVLAEAAEVGSRYILCDRYVTLTELAETASEALGGVNIPRVMPLWLGMGVSIMGEALARLIKKAPLIPAGQLHFLQWGAVPRSDRAQSELDWNVTPLPEGMRKTVEFLSA